MPCHRGVVSGARGTHSLAKLHQVKRAPALIAAPGRISSATLSKSVALSGPQFPVCKLNRLGREL